ncbi:hypothetical protein EC973_008893 [Apophysomyces ossiformis]|uniref:FAS1 domain-containing protein n=1 Tax=Apophysomyces ossiformis TaxID=679940 RepID=A0A8H7BZ49_9FUNG|nr:hypothetical protein EC973_008893 [Apophysomyces ossiformis]
MFVPSLLILSILGFNVLAYKTIIDVLSEDPRFETLIGHLQRTRLVPRINRLPAGTFFAPVNEAFDALDENVDEATLLYHILPSGKRSVDFQHGEILQSLYVRPGFLPNNEGQRLKFSRIGVLGRTLIVNEAQVVTKDISVNRNTYIHAIDRVLNPPETIGKWTDKIPALLTRGHRSTLNERSQTILQFVANSAFARAAGSSSTIYGFRSEEDLGRILNYTTLGVPLYIADIPEGKTAYDTLTGEPIIIESSQDAITVNNVPVIETDWLASNGVIHILDDGLIPDSLTFDTRKYLYGINATKMVSLIDTYDLGHYLDSHMDRFYSFLVPPNDVLNEDTIPNIIKKDWLRYHILNASWYPEYLEDGMLLPSELRPEELAGQSQRIPVYTKSREREISDMKDDQSIRFGRSRVFNSLAQSRNMIYQISEPLTLPVDILTSLVLDLELSTFVATLYVSGVIDEMRSARGITVFAPTNDAFQQLGLVAKYLVHPLGKNDLQSVLRYHAAEALLYGKEMETAQLVINTLANVSTNITGTGGRIRMGDATVRSTNRIVSNGVVHKLDQVLLPSNVQITHSQLLTAIEAHAMQRLLKQANISELAKGNILLVPTDGAFDRIDFDALLNDKENLQRIAKLHILKAPSYNGYEFPTLSSEDLVIIRDAGYGLWTVQLKGLNTFHARVLGRANLTKGYLMEIDTVLMPVPRGFLGLPLETIREFVRTMSPLVLCLVGFGGWTMYRFYRRRRAGYETIQDTDGLEANQ